MPDLRGAVDGPTARLSGKCRIARSRQGRAQKQADRDAAIRLKLREAIELLGHDEDHPTPQRRTDHAKTRTMSYRCRSLATTKCRPRVRPTGSTVRVIIPPASHPMKAGPCSWIIMTYRRGHLHLKRRVDTDGRDTYELQIGSRLIGFEEGERVVLRDRIYHRGSRGVDARHISPSARLLVVRPGGPRQHKAPAAAAHSTAKETAMMTHETQRQETVIAIWNPTLTLKICLGETIAQAWRRCESQYADDNCLPAWPLIPAPSWYPGTGSRTSAGTVSRTIDYDFVPNMRRRCLSG